MTLRTDCAWADACTAVTVVFIIVSEGPVIEPPRHRGRRA
jgi:hypothetical protein